MSVTKTKTGYDVIVKYAGWADNWNEKLSWKSDRLAPLFSYSRRVKGFVKIFSTNNNVWPCRVYFRMPSPGNDVAEDMLRLEPKLLCEPYNAEALESKYMKILAEGLWLNCSQCVEPFDLSVLTDERSNTLAKSREGFAEAFMEACGDPLTIGFVPQEEYIIAGTSLLYNRFRVQGPARATAKRFDGCLGDAPVDHYLEQIEKMMSHKLIQSFLLGREETEIDIMESEVKKFKRKGENLEKNLGLKKRTLVSCFIG